MTHEGRRVVVGRQQLEGMINSPDTSVHITAERRDRPRDGGTERAEGEGNKKEEANVVKERTDACERDARRQRGGGRGKRTGPGFRMGGGKDGGAGRPEFSLPT